MNVWRFLSGCVALIALLPMMGTIAAEAFPTNAEISEMLRERLEGGPKGVGIVVGLVDEQGPRVVVYGQAAENGKVALNGDTLFEIGSVTKVFTSIILADMVEHGEVKLDDAISRFLPASLKCPTFQGHPITLASLATQSSGLPRLPDNMQPEDAGNPYADYSVERLYAFLSNYTLTRDVGAKYEYSNLGVGLLGHLLALAARTNYEALVLTRVCLPLGLTNTVITLTPPLRARLAEGHDANGEPVENWDLPTLAGAGALRSTANDLLRFLSANLGFEPTPLDAAVKLARQPRADTGTPELKIGLGWNISTRYGTEITWHNGGTGGYRSFVGFTLQPRRGVVVLANSFKNIDDLGYHLLEPKYELSHAQPKQMPATIQLSAAELKRYVGQYEFVPGVRLNFRADDTHLMAQLTGQGYNEVFPSSPTQFFYKVVNAQLSFVTNQEGKIESVILHQNGMDQTARKVSDKPVPERKAIILGADNLERYTGKYHLRPGADFTLRRQGDQLEAQLTGQSFFPIFPESETEFFYKVVDAQLSFVKDEHGNITALVLHQNGIDQRAEKVK